MSEGGMKRAEAARKGWRDRESEKEGKRAREKECKQGESYMCLSRIFPRENTAQYGKSRNTHMGSPLWVSVKVVVVQVWGCLPTAQTPS